MARLRAERGLVLTELLVVVVMLGGLMGASLTMLEGAQREAPKEESRAESVATAQVQLDRMTRELRQAITVNGWGYNYVDFDVLVGNQTRRVMYDCRSPGNYPGYRACVRREGPQGGALGAGNVIVDRLLNGTDDEAGRVFTADQATTPRFIKVRIEVPANAGRSGGYSHHFELDDGVYLRNLNLG